MTRAFRILGMTIGVLWAPMAFAAGPDAPGPAGMRDALVKAGTFFRERLDRDGTYAWRYSPDGSVREGEGGRIEPGIGWVQPPGTPAVGAAFLRIHQATGDPAFLEAAGRVAHALVATQLVSGGWFYEIETDKDASGRWCYRAQGIDAKACRRMENPERNRTVLDDNNTASVLLFLMWYDRETRKSDPAVGEAVDYGLKRLLKVQYPIGALPVFFTDDAPGADVATATRASLPEHWPLEWQKPETPPYFIVNDNLPRDTGRLFLQAFQATGETRFRRAAEALGDFLLASQLPAPQSGWAQQYDRRLQPVWGRRFEPPAVVSRETAGSIEFLLELHDQTGRADYLAAAVRAGEWLRAARLKDGNWSRYYDLGTNLPLYVDRNDRVTYEPVNLIDHYGMFERTAVEKALERLDHAEKGERPRRPGFWIDPSAELSPEELASRAKEALATQDVRGRWLEDGRIDGARFVENVFLLARALEASSDMVR